MKEGREERMEKERNKEKERKDEAKYSYDSLYYVWVTINQQTSIRSS